MTARVRGDDCASAASDARGAKNVRTRGASMTHFDERAARENRHFQIDEGALTRADAKKSK
jgi:hypothetical protein